MMSHIEKIQGQRGQLAGMANSIGSWTSADDHIGIANSLDLVDVIEVNATVELRIELVEKLHYLRPPTHTPQAQLRKVQWCQTVTFKSVQRHPGLTYILICDIRTLWRSALSARVPECHKLKM